MAQVNGSDHDMLRPHGDELPPSFDPRCAFAWTLRAAESARRKRAGAERRPNGSNPRSASMRTLLARG